MDRQYTQVDAIIMAGGKGSRMGTAEKMLLKVNGEKVIDAIIKILQNLNFNISLCISENTRFLDGYHSLRTIMGQGDYALDLNYAIKTCSLPVLIVPSDVIIKPDMIHDFVTSASSLDTAIATLIVNNKLSGISMFFKKPETGNLPYKNIEILRDDFFNLNCPDDYKKALHRFEK
ncbi:NTP transferase domain-containing protein [Ferroplasma acidiphilum]|jgi:GTP:adenosylcobinamide-phosphate guanylyltransferase|uniref:MobA-like NTP transferase domain-containing protein n=1 Tax=Ferroplasma acidiphilum TaxID=74969 RepID=A0A1V0N4Y4_9ARCH|nr:NTP transferase domain-containing protein [Ferroplasma acidiphilum]ARD85183.1 hypothetical protein FAD_1317 [Ferroplasma acidiphilum]